MDTSPLPTSVDWRANIGTRFWARLIDGVVVAVPTLLITLPASDLEGGQPSTPLWAMALTFAIAAAYEIGFTAMRGQTVGKRLLRIQVVDVTTGRPPGLGSATTRFAVAGVPALLPGPGPLLQVLVYLSAVWSPTRQGWHDRAAGTVVVRTAARQAVTGGWDDPGPAPPGGHPSLPS